MTTQTKFCAIALASLAMWGTLFMTSMAPERASATTDNPGIEITTLMSNVDVAKLPATEIADLF
jgi:hypothetical protein